MSRATSTSSSGTSSLERLGSCPASRLHGPPASYITTSISNIIIIIIIVIVITISLSRRTASSRPHRVGGRHDKTSRWANPLVLSQRNNHRQSGVPSWVQVFHLECTCMVSAEREPTMRSGSRASSVVRGRALVRGRESFFSVRSPKTLANLPNSGCF